MKKRWGALLMLGSLFFYEEPGLLMLVFIAGLILFGVAWGSGLDRAARTATDYLKGCAYTFHNAGTGIGVDPGLGVVALLEKDKQRTYSFADVRGWDTNLVSGGGVVHLGGGGLAGGFAAGAHNVGQARENRLASGFFVKVRDIDNPVWRIDMLRQSDQDRWMEILRQMINEGPVNSVEMKQ